MFEEALVFLGKIVSYGGGAAVISYFIFQFLGKSWIESKFAERLDQLKHQHALELLRLRIEIDSLLSGVLKLQERDSPRSMAKARRSSQFGFMACVARARIPRPGPTEST